MAEDAFVVDRVTKRFGRTTTALDALTLLGPRGKVIALLGPNGAGKTTAIRVLATLLRPDSGRAFLAGFDVQRQPSQVRRRIALSGQHASVDEELTGRANLVLVGRLLDLTRRQAVARAEQLLSDFRLADAGARRVAGYSGGMRRRLDLAVSLVGHPEVLFLDEPSAGLDPGRRDELWGMIRGLSNDGVTVLLTTQYLEEADALADLVTVIDDGRAIASGTPAELKQQVGGHTIHLRVADPGDAAAAADILTAVTGRPAVRSARDDLVVPGPDADDFFEITARLRARGIGLSEASLRLPSLDEVFLTLTGKGTAGHEEQRTATPSESPR